MRNISATTIADVITDLESELNRLELLEVQVRSVQLQMEKAPHLKDICVESLALKLHNFYTGCERIFQIIVSELNGGKPSSYDWHRRLLERMALAQDYRPPVIRGETLVHLKDYLAFRHIVRNIYGFELDFDRLETLVQNYFKVHQNFLRDLQDFIGWLRNFEANLTQAE